MRICLLRQMLPQRDLSICTYVYHLSHLCTLQKPLDGMRCHLAGALMWSQVMLYQTGPSPPTGRENFMVGTPGSPVCSNASYHQFTYVFADLMMQDHPRLVASESLGSQTEFYDAEERLNSTSEETEVSDIISALKSARHSLKLLVILCCLKSRSLCLML